MKKTILKTLLLASVAKGALAIVPQAQADDYAALGAWDAKERFQVRVRGIPPSGVRKTVQVLIIWM